MVRPAVTSAIAGRVAHPGRPVLWWCRGAGQKEYGPSCVRRAGANRWEYYGPDQTIEKIGFSRENDGKEDAWSYAGSDGSIARIEISTRRDGKIMRREYYAGGVLARAEEASDEDGKIEKWETYEEGCLASVAFDARHRGTPDRRACCTAPMDQRGWRSTLPATGTSSPVVLRLPCGRASRRCAAVPS